MNGDRRSASRAASQVGAELRRRGGEAEARIARGIGEPALFAIALSGVGATIYLVLGVVAGDALGLTPIVFALSGVFFVVTMLTYVEASSLHPERGGASMFARYAFDELWSFIAGWAILLDYLIVHGDRRDRRVALPGGILGRYRRCRGRGRDRRAHHHLRRLGQLSGVSPRSATGRSCGWRSSASCSSRP